MTDSMTSGGKCAISPAMNVSRVRIENAPGDMAEIRTAVLDALAIT